MMNKTYTLAQALHLCQQAENSPFTSPQFAKYLSAALRYYVFPSIVSLDEVILAMNLLSIAETISISQLKEMKSIFTTNSQQAIADGKISQGTINNYRSALMRFDSWLHQQIWWQELLEVEMSSVAPYRPKVAAKPTTKKLDSYGLLEIPPQLVSQINDYREFRLSGAKNLRRQRRRQQRQQSMGSRITPKMVAVKESTVEKEVQAICCFWGWHQQFLPQEPLELSLLTLPDKLAEYTNWMVNYRHVTYSTGVTIVGTGINIAKWLNYHHCQRRDWSDISIIGELQDLQAEYKEIYQKEKKAKQKQKWSKKELTHPQARQVVLYLYDLCSPNYGKHNPKTREFLPHGTRRLSAVARAWQEYLITKILVYLPIRQEEVRGLELGKTLFRRLDEDGNPYYETMIKEHKRDNQGIVRNYRLPSILTADLDVWLQKWRPLIVDAVKNDLDWLKYWGYHPEKLANLQQRVKLAKQGIVGAKVQVSCAEYLRREETRLEILEKRMQLRQKALANLASHNYLFFIQTMGKDASFGKPHSIQTIWHMVTDSIALATKALFGEEKWTNPHALRHIAEKHIRLLGKGEIADKFGVLIGHSKEMGDEYAAQITTDYELSEKIVDNWWLEDG